MVLSHNRVDRRHLFDDASRAVACRENRLAATQRLFAISGEWEDSLGRGNQKRLHEGQVYLSGFDAEDPSFHDVTQNVRFGVSHVLARCLTTRSVQWSRKRKRPQLCGEALCQMGIPAIECPATRGQSSAFAKTVKRLLEQGLDSAVRARAGDALHPAVFGAVLCCLLSTVAEDPSDDL